MAVIPEIELLKVHNHYHLNPPVPERNDSGGVTFWLLCLVSGMKSGAFLTPDGNAAYSVQPGGPCQAALVLLPPGSRAEARFAAIETEAFSYFFRCTELVWDATRSQTFLRLPNGSRQQMYTVRTLGAYEVVTMRPVFEKVITSFWAGNDDGAMIRAQLLFNGLFAHMFAIPFAREEYEYMPEQKLEKAIEREGHRVKLREMAAETGHSLRWVRERFRREYGTTPGVAKAHQTCHLARWFIENTEIPFKIIAERLGMSSANYFSHFVRRHFCTTPREMRKAAMRRAPKDVANENHS